MTEMRKYPRGMANQEDLTSRKFSIVNIWQPSLEGAFCPLSLLWTFLLLAIILLIVPVSVSAKHKTCHIDGIKPTKGDFGYQKRENGSRCEGTYTSPIGVNANQRTTIELISVLNGQLSFDLKRHKLLKVSSPNISYPTSGPIRVRAISLPKRTYYQMDAHLPLHDVLDWPIHEVLSKLEGLTDKKIGVLGKIGSEEDPIYVPLKIAPEDEAGTFEKPVELIVRAPVDIDFLQWRAYIKGENVMPEWKNLIGILNATWPISIRLPLGQSTVMTVEIQAKLKYQQTWLKTLEFDVIRVNQ